MDNRWSGSPNAFDAVTAAKGACRVWHDMLAEGFARALHRVERLM
jgi:hypothetical protein